MKQTGETRRSGAASAWPRRSAGAYALLGAVLLCSACAGRGPAAPSAASTASTAEFLGWIEGEWSNNEQVWQQGVDEKAGRPVADPVERILTQVVRVEAPGLGRHVLYARERGDGVGLLRQRLYVLEADGTALRLTPYVVREAAMAQRIEQDPTQAAALTMEDVHTLPGCASIWTRATASYRGRIEPSSCRYERDGREYRLEGEFELGTTMLRWQEREFDPSGGARWLWGRLVSRKLRYFDGWAVLHRKGPDAQPGDDDYLIVRPLRLHSEGQIVELKWEDGRPTGYALELAQLTYQSSGIPILKLALIEQSSGKSFAYTWTNPEAKRIGINLRWIQAGFTEAESAAAARTP